MLRGFGAPGVHAALQDLANEIGVAECARFERPEPAAEVVKRANDADMGVHPIPGLTTQTRLCLPNKFFEYAMAGLALCVSDVREMAALVRRHDMGVVIREHSPDGIAAAMNVLTPGAGTRYKRAALEGAKELCWEQERRVLTDDYARLDRE